MSGREWAARAVCRDVDPEVFFPLAEAGPELVRQEARAKRVCAGCPVLAECREFAVAELGHWVAGGLSESERRELRARLPRPAVAAAAVAVVVPSSASKRELATAGRAAIRAGAGRAEVAREFGVTPRTVERWVAQAREEQRKRGAA
ncbi:WhiB family transcriptional regulator [Pseudonocardia sp. T1-2H]|uniref:WhiB family transcriptional regulator n=1 Tax=Pseudonocardia sp. T1-2H TaxID=3128899 RepID=UPI00310196A5